MEKYGFVYLWFDRKHKRYYVGCRWGTTDDGYICSSPWMKQAYKHRPEDFKRRILSKIYTNKKDLLLEEYHWLVQIKNEELGKKYYNLHNHHCGHWTADENAIASTKERMRLNHRSKRGMSNSGKYKPQKETSMSKLKGDERTEAQQKATVNLSETLTGQKRGPYPKEHDEKVSAARKGKPTGLVPKSAFKKGQTPWNKGLKLKKVEE